jgi:hypothetical protein
MSDVALNVTGAPDESLLTDNNVKSRLSALLPALREALTSSAPGAADAASSTAPEDEGARAIPTASGELTSGDLASLTYHLQLFQERVLGASAPARPANPSATEPSHKHPLRIPSKLFLTSPSYQNHSGAISPETAPLFSILKAALLYLQKHGRKGWADMLDEQQRAFYTELIANVRKSLKEQDTLKPVRLTGEKDWSQAEVEQYQKLAEQLEREYRPASVLDT